MIERVYLDNIRTFVNFEWRPGPLAILLGANGSGKSALLKVLEQLQSFLLGERSSMEAFGETTRTRWDRRREQTIELDVKGNGGVYQYRLVIEHAERQPGNNRIASEILRYDGKPLVKFEGGMLHLFQDDVVAGPVLKAKETRSGIGALEPSDNTRLLAWFKDWLYRVWLHCPDPRAMVARVDQASSGSLEPNLSNFAAWYLRKLTIKPGAMFKAAAALSKVLPGFLELHEQGGYLHARFGDDRASESFRFDELSDGQRALIALYVLRHAVAEPGKVLAIDEPDNYVSLREIQPWLTEVMDLALAKDGPQIWIISHHPEVLNLLALDYGWRFFREGTGPTRVERFQPAAGLDAAETVARGWEDA